MGADVYSAQVCTALCTASQRIFATRWSNTCALYRLVALLEAIYMWCNPGPPQWMAMDLTVRESLDQPIIKIREEMDPIPSQEGHHAFGDDRPKRSTMYG